LLVDEDEPISAKACDPDGRSIVLLERIWEKKIIRGHPEMSRYLPAVLATLTDPQHIEPDPRTGRSRYYRSGIGPSRWLLVVVSFEQQPGRIITALATRKDPARWKP